LVTATPFEIICPRCIIRKTDRKDDSGNLLLEPSKRTANLRWIKYNMREPVFIRLLLCKESIKASDPSFCPYPKYKNKWAIKRICKSKEKLAHIYFSYEHPKKVYAGTRSCIVIFSKNNQNADDFAERLKSTVTQLGIKGEKFDLHVIPFCYEKISVIPPYRHKLKREIKDRYEDSRLIIKNNILMNEKNDLMILKIDHNLEDKEFLINPIVRRESD
jgi:hypothetical protein